MYRVREIGSDCNHCRTPLPTNKRATAIARIACGDGSGTADTPGLSTGADTVKPLWSVLPDVVTTVPAPGAGRSISRNELSPFGFVVGISLPSLSRIANVNVSGPERSGFEVAARWKLRVLPGVNANWTSLKKELSVRVAPNGEGLTTIPPVLEVGEGPIEPAPAAKFERVTVLFASPEPFPSMNWKSSVNGPFPTSGEVFIVIVSAQAKLADAIKIAKRNIAVLPFMANPLLRRTWNT